MSTGNRRAALLGLSLAGLGLYWLGGYAGSTLTSPHPGPWWELTLLAPDGGSGSDANTQHARAATPPRHRLALAPPRLGGATVDGPAGPVEVAAGEALFTLTGDRDQVLDALAAAGARWAGVGAGSGVGRVAFGAEVPLHEVRARMAAIDGIADVRANPVVRGAGNGNGGGSTTDGTTSDAPTDPVGVVVPSALCGPGDLVGYQWERDVIHSPLSCNQDSTAPAVTIAVLDTGVAYEDWTDASGVYAVAPELDGVPFVAPYDFVNLDEHANDDHQHGTHLAGLIASRDRLRGHAPNPVLMPVKVLDDQMMGTEWGLVEGMYWAADHGAQVINLSLTFGPGYVPSGDLLDAMMEAHLAGAVVVAAAGNANADGIAFPAALNGVIAVGAFERGSGSDVVRAGYSNRGLALDVMGPGGNLDADIDSDGVPDGMLAQTIDPLDPTQFAYWAIAGTSQATAVVSAQAAHALGTGVDPRSVRDALLVAARKVDSKTVDQDLEGGGLVDSAGIGAATGALDSPPTYVQVVQGIASSAPGERHLVARIRVLDEQGDDVPLVSVQGHITGSAVADFDIKVDSVGTPVTVVGPSVVAGPNDPLIFALQVDAVLTGRPAALSRMGAAESFPRSQQRVLYPAQPGPVYGLDEGTHELITTAAQEGEVDDGEYEVDEEGGMVPLLFRVSPADSTTGSDSVCGLFDCNTLEESYMVQALGSGLSASTVNVSFNWPYLQSIVGSGLSASTVNVMLSRSYDFAWGTASSQPMEVVDISGSGLSASTVNVLRWNPWSFSTSGSGFASSTVNVLSYDPRIWGTGFASSTVYFIDEFSPLWGSGFASSTVNAMDLFGPSSGGGLSAWGTMWGSGLSASTVNAFTWTRITLPSGASVTSGGAPAAVVGASSLSSALGAVETNL